MKYVVLGSLGNISKPLAEKLIAAGHEVTIVSSSAERAQEITALGAKAAIGGIEDTAFLTKTFTGADAVYPNARRQGERHGLGQSPQPRLRQGVGYKIWCERPHPLIK